MCWCCKSKPKASPPIETDMSVPSKKQVSQSKAVSQAVHVGERRSFSQVPSVPSTSSSQLKTHRVEVINAQQRPDFDRKVQGAVRDLIV